MLIVYIFNFESAIIGLLLIQRLGEELHNVIFGKQGTVQNLYDLYDWTSKFEIVLNDSDMTVCDDGNMNLNTYGIAALPLERFNNSEERDAEVNSRRVHDIESAVQLKPSCNPAPAQGKQCGRRHDSL